MKFERVAVLGGSGFVGRQVINLLANRSCAVITPTRAREHAKSVVMLPQVQVTEVDVRDPAALASAIRGVDAVINLVGVLHDRRGAGFNDIHVGVTDAAIQACRRNGIRRLIQMSALNADPEGPSAYLRSKGAAESRVAASGLDWTIFQPSVIFGPGDRFLNLFASLTRFVPVIALAGANARFQPVHVGDVVAALVGALDDDRTIGQRYPLCGPNVYTLRELVAYAAKQVGRRRPIFGLPEALGMVQAAVFENLPGRLLTRDNLLSMRVDSICDCPYPAVFNAKPRAIEDTVPQYLQPGDGADWFSAYRRHRR